MRHFACKNLRNHWYAWDRNLTIVPALADMHLENSFFLKMRRPMVRTVSAGQNENHMSPRKLCGVVDVKGILCLSFLELVLIAPARADVMITLAKGVTNPPPSVASTALAPQQIAVADTATLVPVANFSGILQATLNAQGFTNANNWTLVTNAVALANNATFNITAYNLSLNPGGDNQGGIPNGTPAGSAFGETMEFTLNPNLAAPANVPVGPNVTEHWLQIINESRKFGGFGYPIQGQPGFWQLDDGDKPGGAAAGAATGPYYDSNNGGKVFSVPPPFHDFVRYASGVGTYLHFDSIPTWDVFTPAADGKPATETIDVGNFGLAWGFTISPAVVMPEPSSIMLVLVGSASIFVLRRSSKSDASAGA
jgi:hypothetical protein